MKKKMLFIIATIVAFALFVPSVWAATVEVDTAAELIECVKDTGNECVLTADISVSNVDLSSGYVDIPTNKTLTMTGNSKVYGEATIKNNGLIVVENGVLDASELLFTDKMEVGLIPNQEGKIRVMSDGIFIGLDIWNTMLASTGGWKPSSDSHIFDEECEEGAVVLSSNRTYVYYNNTWRGAVQVGDKYYETMAAAVDDDVVNGTTATTVKLLADVTTYEGIKTVEKTSKKIVFDLNGHTLTFAEGALVGSSGTVSQNIHIERGSVIEFKNGKMIASPDSRMFLQNYCDLTLTDVNIDSTGVTTTNKYYTVSLNQGTINITGNTSIKAKSVAFDAYWWPDMGYTGGALVTVNTTGTIEGIIEVDASKNPEDSMTVLKIENINHNGSLNVLKDELKDNVTISGGKYSTDVDAYVVDGKYAEKIGTIYEVKEYSQNADVTPVDPKEEVEETTVGLTKNEKTEDTLLESLEEVVAGDSELQETIKNTHVVVVVDVAPVKKEQLNEKTLAEIEKVAKDLIIADYFDINVLINDDDDNTLGIIPELTKKIELMVVLPEKLVNTDKNINRKYYVIREHEGKVEIIKDVKLSDDGKSLTFESDKFSTYALAYEDEVVTDKKEENPKTGDINLAMLIGTILVGTAGAVIISKKRFAKSN